MPFAQDIIHKFEAGGGMRPLRIGLALLAVIVFIGGYNLRAFRNFSNQEAMDQAQLARNLAEGKGFTTHFIRPFSMYLVKRVNEKKGSGGGGGNIPDYAQVRTMHPDIANPPVYPTLVAGLLKVLPFSFNAATTKSPWTSGGKFWRYPPDFTISFFNQLIFFGMIAALFFLAKRLFDPTVAWLSAIILFTTDLFWRFAVSGLSTSLLMLIFAGLLWWVVVFDQEVREPKRGQAAWFGMAALAGVIVGFGCLTRYGFGWFIVPVMIYLAIFGGPRRGILWLVAFLAFVLTISPWMARNIWVSGTPFGTATFTALEGTILFPEARLLRSLTPVFDRVGPMIFWYKLCQNAREILLNDIPQFCGNWSSAFFLAGLLVPFRNPALQRLRYFVFFCLPILVIAQAMGRTQLTSDSPVINSENLLVILSPIIILYGVAFFLGLVEQLELPLSYLRYVFMGVFAFILAIPILLVFLPPKTVAVAYPPYYPPVIQQVSNYLKEDEMMMSDVPWAVAWYGHRQAIWLTLNAQSEFFAVNDSQKPINALYLTPMTMDARFLSQWVRAGEKSWGNFILDGMIRREIPPWFPLRAAPTGFLPEQLFLADWERWRLSAPPSLQDTPKITQP